MTQQLDHPVLANPTRPEAHLDPTMPAGTNVGAPVTAHAPTPGVAPPPYWGPPAQQPMPYPMTQQMAQQMPPTDWAPGMSAAPQRSTGKLIAILVGAGTAGLLVVLLVIGIIAGLMGSSTPAPAAAPAPSVPSSSTPSSGSSAGSPAADPAASRTATQSSFDAAGVRLDKARATFDQQLEAASKAGNVAGFRAAARTFRQELETYKATVTGLAMPADQHAQFSGVLVPALDATIADASAMENARSASALTSAAGSFDQHWGLVVATHNRMDHALLNG